MRAQFRSLRDVYGCPMFAQVHMGRRRRAKPQSLILSRSKAFEKNVFGPRTLARTWGTRRYQLLKIVFDGSAVLPCSAAQGSLPRIASSIEILFFSSKFPRDRSRVMRAFIQSERAATSVDRACARYA
jgi:hypothetical protein